MFDVSPVLGHVQEDCTFNRSSILVKPFTCAETYLIVRVLKKKQLALIKMLHALLAFHELQL